MSYKVFFFKSDV
jgi:hypothetical protein